MIPSNINVSLVGFVMVNDEIKNQYVYNQLYELSKSIIDTNFKNLMDITDGDNVMVSR